MLNAQCSMLNEHTKGSAMSFTYRSRVARLISCLIFVTALAVTAAGCEGSTGVGLGFDDSGGSPGGFDPYPTAIRIGGGPVAF
jgi:hypothetical protein